MKFVFGSRPAARLMLIRFSRCLHICGTNLCLSMHRLTPVANRRGLVDVDHSFNGLHTTCGLDDSHLSREVHLAR